MERADVAIAIELLDRMDDEGVAWSVYERLKKITQQSSRSVERSIHRLVVTPGGYFERVKNAGRERSPRFRPIMPASSAAQSPPDMAAISESPPSVTEKPAISGGKSPPYLAGDSTLGIPLSDSSFAIAHETRARTEEFDAWWDEYPNKVGKRADAEKAYRAAVARGASPEMLMAATRKYVATKPPDRHWCNPLTWLNGDRWLDKPAPPPLRNNVIVLPRADDYAARQLKKLHQQVTDQREAS